MTLSNVFDVYPQNPLDEYNLTALNNNVNYPYAYPVANQYAALNNRTNLAGLRQDTYGPRNYYYGSNVSGEHKGLNWKHVLTGAVVFAGAVASLKFGLSKVYSCFKNSKVLEIEKQIKNAKKAIAQAKYDNKINEKVSKLKEELKKLNEKLSNISNKV